MKKLEFLGRSLSKDEQKKIMGGSEFDETEDGGGGFSCECVNGKSAGMVSCDTCEHWCSTNGHGAVKTCD
jgi:hypothetical protein